MANKPVSMVNVDCLNICSSCFCGCVCVCVCVCVHACVCMFSRVYINVCVSVLACCIYTLVNACASSEGDFIPQSYPSYSLTYPWQPPYLPNRLWRNHLLSGRGRMRPGHSLQQRHLPEQPRFLQLPVWIGVLGWQVWICQPLPFDCLWQWRVLQCYLAWG